MSLYDRVLSEMKLAGDEGAGPRRNVKAKFQPDRKIRKKSDPETWRGSFKRTPTERMKYDFEKHPSAVRSHLDRSNFKKRVDKKLQNRRNRPPQSLSAPPPKAPKPAPRTPPPGAKNWGEVARAKRKKLDPNGDRWPRESDYMRPGSGDKEGGHRRNVKVKWKPEPPFAESTSFADRVLGEVRDLPPKFPVRPDQEPEDEERERTHGQARRGDLYLKREKVLAREKAARLRLRAEKNKRERDDPEPPEYRRGSFR
jgi:hypothetical protein